MIRERKERMLSITVITLLALSGMSVLQSAAAYAIDGIVPLIFSAPSQALNLMQFASLDLQSLTQYLAPKNHWVGLAVPHNRDSPQVICNQWTSGNLYDSQPGGGTLGTIAFTITQRTLTMDPTATGHLQLSISATNSR